MIDPRTLIELYNSGDSAVLSQFGDLLFGFERSVVGLTQSIATYNKINRIGDSCRVPTQRLVEAGYDFHTKAGTLTKRLQDHLARVNEQSPIVRIAHQPNLFPYLGVLAQFFLLAKTSMALESKYGLISLPVFLIVDYDEAGDARFRVAHFLNATKRDGDLALSSYLGEKYRDVPMYLVPKPSEEVVEKWLDSIKFGLMNDIGLLRSHGIWVKKEMSQLRSNISVIVEDIWESYRKSKTFSEFNAFFLSRVVNLRFDLPILFVPGNKIHRHYGRTWAFFVEREHRIINETIRSLSILESRGLKLELRVDPSKFPFWYVCDGCLKRVGLYHLNDHLVGGVCQRCKKTYAFEASEIFAEGRAFSGFIPTVIIDDISDIVALGASGGVSYIGSAEHIIVSNLVARHIGIEPFHQVVWRPKMFCLGVSEVAALLKMSSSPTKSSDTLMEKLVELSCGRNSLLYYLSNFEPKSILDSWYSHFEVDGAFARVNYDTSLTPLKLKREDFKKMDPAKGKLLTLLGVTKRYRQGKLGSNRGDLQNSP